MTTNDKVKVEGSCPKLNVRLEDGPSERWGLSTWIAYFSVFVVMLAYCAFLYDRNLFHTQGRNIPGLSSLETLFDAIEKYSPFHEYLMDDNYSASKLDSKIEQGNSESVSNESANESTDNVRLLTPEELKAYDGKEGSPGLYIALLGQVFDVSKGMDHYGPGGGYSFFAAKDGSRAFVTGEFNEAGLVDDLTGLDSESYLVSY